MISIRSFPGLRGKASSKPARQESLSRSSFLNREPLDFDLVSQLTHMSAVATAGISRDRLFEGTSNLDYSTSRFFRRVHLVSQRLNYDYSRACELVADTVGPDSVRNLLLHFSTSLSAGEPEAEFLARETDVQLELYGKQYERDMESLRKWTDAYVALMVSTTLIVVISLISMMIYSFAATAIVGLSAIVAVTTVAGAWVVFSVAPHEMKTHRLPRKSAEQYQVERLGFFVVPIAGGFGVLLWFLFGMGAALIGAALVLAPVGFVAMRDDWKIDARDQDIATFLRALGSAMAGVGTSVAEGLSRLNRRALGSLEPNVRRLHVWLTNDISSDLCWLRFAGETGSELVTRSVRIFWDGLRMGGDAGEVGALASAYALKITVLRATRKMVANTFAFVIVPMHGVILAIMLFITEVMRIFGGELSKVQTESLNSDIVNEAGVGDVLLFAAPNMEFITMFVGLMILLLTAANSFAPYAATGGNRFKIFLYASVIMFISGVALLVIPSAVSTLFESVARPPQPIQS
jgi:flagellar protein FlaJ